LPKIELAGIADHEIKTDRELDVERAHDQIGAPVRIPYEQRQHRDDHRRD
jgi:hypothetical protein